MEFLAKHVLSRNPFMFVALLSMALGTGGCTYSFSKDYVTSIPMVMLAEVPIPNEAKQPEPSAKTMSQDIALSVWFLGAEGWESDATALAMGNPTMHSYRESYFEAQFESLFLNILAMNFESVTLRGHWVRMVPKSLPPLDRKPVLEYQLPTTPNEASKP